MGRKKVVMEETEARDFQALLRQGLEQYGITPARVAPLSRSAPTPIDRLATRLKIQSEYRPLDEAGYRTNKQITKLVENALSRPVHPWRARLAIFALIQSQAAVTWRRKNGWPADIWYARVHELERNRVEYALTPFPAPEPRDPNAELAVWMHPAAILPLANFIAGSLRARGFIKRAEMPQAAATIAHAIKDRREDWQQAFIEWLNMGEFLFNVGVVEKDEMQPEGENLHLQRLVVKQRRQGRPPGRKPTHCEFVKALVVNAEAGYAKHLATRG